MFNSAPQASTSQPPPSSSQPTEFCSCSNSTVPAASRPRSRRRSGGRGVAGRVRTAAPPAAAAPDASSRSPPARRSSGPRSRPTGAPGPRSSWAARAACAGGPLRPQPRPPGCTPLHPPQRGFTRATTPGRLGKGSAAAARTPRRSGGASPAPGEAGGGWAPKGPRRVTEPRKRRIGAGACALSTSPPPAPPGLAAPLGGVSQRPSTALWREKR